MENNMFPIQKEKLEILILNYLFSHLKKDHYGSRGFANLEKLPDGYIDIKLDYLITKEDESLTKKISILLESKGTYTREKCIKLANEMYLRDENAIAFILKILNPNTKFN